jgi:hypothetical protein
MFTINFDRFFKKMNISDQKSEELTSPSRQAGSSRTWPKPYPGQVFEAKIQPIWIFFAGLQTFLKISSS